MDSDSGDEVPTLCTMKPEGNDDEDSDGWDEMEEGSEQTTCLFCTSQFRTIAVALDHCRTEHNFDLLALKTKYNMDFYSYIKMINFLRLHKVDAKSVVESPTVLWDDDKYLKTVEMETWLMYDFDDLGSAPSTPHYAIDGKTPISNINFADLQKQIQELTTKVQEKDFLLKQAYCDMEKMKEVTKTILDVGDDLLKTQTRNVASVSVSGDSDYFNSYSHFGIHHEMLTDSVRTESYRNAILNNSKTFKDKTVLDIGCGTGILSMFSAKAGAKIVYGIDQSEVIYKAMDIIRENKLEDKIHLVKGRLEDTYLPTEKVDIIVSEWMGYFLLFEGMLDSVIYARNNHLNPNGLILPNRCTISLVGCSNLERYNKYINFWNNVYGFSMNCMKSEVITEACIETVPTESIITSSSLLTNIDLNICTTNACEFISPFKLNVEKSGPLTCLVGYFDTYFELPEIVSFSTGPQVTRTHWQQTVFYLKDIIEVKAGDVLEGTLTCTRLKKNVRGLSVTIKLGSYKCEYIID